MVIDIVEIRTSFIVYAQPMLDLLILRWDLFKLKEVIMLWITGLLVNMELELQALELVERVKGI
jgi:hypothetical protein